MEGMLENLTGVGVIGSGYPDGRGSLNLKIRPWGLLSILPMFQLLQSISFQKIAFCFQILLFFLTTDSPSFVEATCDNLKISRKIT